MENPQPIIDERQSGLSAFFAKIYGLVGVGILISALVSFITIKFFPQNLVSIMQGGNVMVFIIFLIPLLIVFPAQRAAAKNSPTALPLFILYSAVLGFILSFSLIFYTGTDITMAFLISAGMFFGMSVYGRFTKRNLSGMAKAMIAGVWGLIILGFLNMLFFHSTPLMLLGSVLGIVIFSGLIAYHNQMIENIYNKNNGQVNDGWAISMALSLYISFVNLFLSVLRIIGVVNRR